MGYVKCRQDKLNKRRYTAVYRDVRGIERSAGTFTRKERAARAWKSAEAAVADGRYLDADQGRKRFADYARETWLPQFEGEDMTVQSYGFYLEKYLIPEFGATRMIEVTPGRVRAFYALLRDAGIGVSVIERCKTVLCSLFNTAVNDRVVGHHPCRGVAGPTSVQAPLKILTPAEYARLHANLRDEYVRLMVDVLLESGCRWGEFAELRAGDLDHAACTLTIARTVIEVDPTYTQAGEDGFRVKAYPKNRHWRKVAISRELADRLSAHLGARGRQALIFPALGRPGGRMSHDETPEGTQATTFTIAGRTFTHGTLYAYTKGACRCEQCREAVAAYRAARRGAGKDRPPKEKAPAAVREARHMRRDWFRHRVFQPAAEAAGLEWRPRVHDLRHASASWALAGGATVQQVREHLGHTSLRAVERYLHNLPGAEAGAAGAIARVKATGALHPVSRPSYTPPGPSLQTTERRIEPGMHQAADHVPSIAVTAASLRCQDGPDPQAQAAPAPAAPLVLALTVTLTEQATGTARNASTVIHIVDADASEGKGITLTADESGETLSVFSQAADAPEGYDSAYAAISPRTLTTEPAPSEFYACAADSHQRSTSQQHRDRPRTAPAFTQDRYSDDRHETDQQTHRYGSRALASATGTSHSATLKLRPQPNTPASAFASANEGPRASGGTLALDTTATLAWSSSQTPSASEKGSEGSAPRTNHGQKIKKPISSTTGDRL